MKRLVEAASPELFQVAQPPLALNARMGVSAVRGEVAALATALTAARPNTSVPAAAGCCGKKTWAGSRLGLEASPALSAYGLGLPSKSNCGCSGGTPGSPFTGLGVTEPGATLKAGTLGAKRLVAESDLADLGLPVTSGGSGKDRGWAQSLLQDAHRDASVVGVVPEWSLAPKALGPRETWEVRGATEDFLGGKAVYVPRQPPTHIEILFGGPRHGGDVRPPKHVLWGSGGSRSGGSLVEALLAPNAASGAQVPNTWVVERRLLEAIVHSARQHRSWPPSGIWSWAWEALAREGQLESAVPPSVALFEAIVSAALTQPLASPLEVLKIALAALAPPLPGAADPFAIDKRLFDELFASARQAQPRQTVDEAFSVAWAARAAYSPWPISRPSRLFVNAIVNVARNASPDEPRASALNRSKAVLLLDLLAVGFVVEPQLLELIVAVARASRDAVWDHHVAALEDLSPVAQGALDSLVGVVNAFESESERVEKERARLGRELAFLLNRATDEVWQIVTTVRGRRLDLPWPPEPRPDRALLKAIIHIARTTPDSVSPEGALALALAFLGRTGSENIASVSSALEGGEPTDRGRSDIDMTIVIYNVLFLYCLADRNGDFATDCRKMLEAFWTAIGRGFVWIGEGIAGWFEDDPAAGGDTPTPVPAGPPMPVPKPPPTPPKSNPTPPKPIPPGSWSDRVGSPYLGMPVIPKPAGDPAKPKPKPKPGDVSTDFRTDAPDLSLLEGKFLSRLCLGALALGHGFQARDLLRVMFSESYFTLDPSRGSKSGAMGINQIQLPELQKVRPGMTRKEYTSLSRADQMEVVVDYFLHYMEGQYAGGEPVTRDAPANWSTTQRGAVLYWMNFAYPGSASINWALRANVFPASKNVLAHLPPDVQAQYVAANKPLNRNMDDAITLGELEATLNSQKNMPALQDWLAALDKACPAAIDGK